MPKLTPSSRLKVKRDTVFLPVPNGVYFRNNISTFRMEGSTIYQWVEKLMPMFNGEKTLGELTKGLTVPYRNRVYGIGETLIKGGFVRDISHDLPHQLNQAVLDRYASQIEFIECFTESGAFRFQQYRQAKVLAIGAGTFFVSLVGSLLESGLPKFHIAVTDAVPTNRNRINELVEQARMTDREVEVSEVSVPLREGKICWKEVIQPYDWIFYVSQEGNIGELRLLNRICKEEKKAFIPAVCLEQIGLAGPLFYPEEEGCWESAWRRYHKLALRKDKPPQTVSTTAGAILANVAVFEFFKKASGIVGQNSQIYRLDLETLEGEWLAFLIHPLVRTKLPTPALIKDLEQRLDQDVVREEQPSILLDYFHRLTSPETGIFHIWEERNLTQLPLSQCYVQPVNPVSDGPAELLSGAICAGLTHEEALREAGLTGIEMYVSKLIESPVCEMTDKSGKPLQEAIIGIGAGETTAEALCRGLQGCLERIWRLRKAEPQTTLFHLEPGKIEDLHCRYYLDALTTLTGKPVIGMEQELLGFPAIWVKSNGTRYTGIGLNRTLALRSALKQALLAVQNQVKQEQRQVETAVIAKTKEAKLNFFSCEEMKPLELFRGATRKLNRNSLKLDVYDLSFEPFLKETLAGVYGICLRKGDS